LYHSFRIDAFYDLYNLLTVRKTGKQEVIFLHRQRSTNSNSHAMGYLACSLELVART
jgi:hypothetical protein